MPIFSRKWQITEKLSGQESFSALFKCMQFIAYISLENRVYTAGSRGFAGRDKANMEGMDMDSKADYISMGPQPTAANLSVRHIHSADDNHGHSHRNRGRHNQGHHVQDRHNQDRHVRGHHDLDRLRAHLVVDVILALLVSSFSGSLTFLYS